MDTIGTMPKQAIPYKEKDEEWGKTCIDGILGLISSNTSSRRSSMKNKRANYRLYNGEFDKQDFRYVTNPLGLSSNELPAELKHMDITSPIIRLLKGEESRRIFEAVIKVVNEEAISEKEKFIKDKMSELIQQIYSKYIQQQTDQNGQPIQPSEDDQKQIEKMNRFLRFNYQDARERTATHLLEYYKRYLGLKDLFVEGWEDALISSEEIYRVDLFGSQVSVQKKNPLEIYFLLPHNSTKIDDAECIVEETWMSYSQIIDEFRSELTDDEVYEIEQFSLTGGTFGGIYNASQRLQILDVDDIDNIEYSFGYSFDSRGNIRILKAVWKSKKKIGIVTYFDEQLGEDVEVVVDELYKPAKHEKVKWEWINEYWEGVKIGNSIYKKIQPCAIQRRHMDNISQCYSPYIGSVYSANNAVAVSLLDRIKVWQYLYNIIWFRTETAIAKSMGKIMEFDLASVPTMYGFDMDKWLYYLQAMNISFKNSREESNKGVALGMMSANATATREVNMEQGQYINMHIQLLSFIEQKIGRLAGVSEQRLGAIEQRELVNNVEKSISQSSLITEDMYRVHNDVKRRVYAALIECAKYSLRNGGSKKLSYITDELSSVIFDITDDFPDAEYGLFVSDSSKDNDIANMLKQFAHAGLQNDKLEFSQVVDIMTTDSISSMKRKLEDFEEQKRTQEQQNLQAQQEQFMAQLQQQSELQNRELELKQYEIDLNFQSEQLDRENKIQLETIRSMGFAQNQDVDADGQPDILELNKLALEQSKHSFDVSQKQQIENNKKHIEESKLSLEKDKLNLEKEKIKSSEKIEKLKAETAIKVAKSNKNRFDGK